MRNAQVEDKTYVSVDLKTSGQTLCLLSDHWVYPIRDIDVLVGRGLC